MLFCLINFNLVFDQLLLLNFINQRYLIQHKTAFIYLKLYSIKILIKVFKFTEAKKKKTRVTSKLSTNNFITNKKDIE